ncbi:nudix hydrolase family protein [Stylonychia lemnae]|uniref:Nudix hydrolase family protein n=1 Tax=Stylonychia lemnae TaxID=5949 RepID=A0A078AAR4_STYLE|nr:nudix hydrolase family protein [Stylonychia lemnae]|eukprot:CDW78687.1 nudix hydrolase family protein [Stylonychia lemnae]
MESIKNLQNFELIDRDYVVVTAQNHLLEPIKCGCCLMDYVQGDYQKNLENFDNCMMIYNKKMNHIHIQCGSKFNYSGVNLDYKTQFFKNGDTKLYELRLEHSDTCPNRIYRRICQDQEMPIISTDKNIKLAVCMALFDSERNLLLTRRNSNLRVFPHAWVMPGGHIDLGESLEEGVVRELKEETGIQIDSMTMKNGSMVFFHNTQELQIEPFYAFESVSSFSIDHKNPPKGGHLIVFFRVQLNQKHSEIKLKLQTEEVDGAVWVDKSHIQRFLNKQDGDFQIKGIVPLDSNGRNQSKMFNLSQLFPNYPNQDREGISKAHNMAIKYMLQKQLQQISKL